MPICPYDGHSIKHPVGDFCADHGVRWFVQCPTCGAPWPTKPSGAQFYARTSMYHERREEPTGPGFDFCAGCGTPGPWLERPQLMEWIRSNVKASPEISAAARLELIEVLSRLEAMDANDTSAVAGWRRLQELAPKVWEATKPVRDVVIGEVVKRLLGL
jgi:hypothetical protein